MVVPGAELGPEARGLEVDTDSGLQDNYLAADDSVDLDDDAEDLRAAGRTGGYTLDYSSPTAAQKEGIISIGTAVELFRTEDEASRYLHDQADDFEVFQGKRIDTVPLLDPLRFDAAGIGEEARALTATVAGN